MLKPYCSGDGYVIYNADCVDVIPSLGDGWFLLTDPPFGISDKWNGGAGGASSWRIKSSETDAWDSKTADEELQLALSVSNDAVVWGGNYYSLPPARGWLVFDKAIPDTFTLGCCELAWTNIDQPIKRIVIPHVQATKGKRHPTQKPLALMRWCMKWGTGNMVLDPFMGSGTTLVAARLEGRHSVGIEVSERYCEIAAQRLEQQVLF